MHYYIIMALLSRSGLLGVTQENIFACRLFMNEQFQTCFLVVFFRTTAKYLLYFHVVITAVTWLTYWRFGVKQYMLLSQEIKSGDSVVLLFLFSNVTTSSQIVIIACQICETCKMQSFNFSSAFIMCEIQFFEIHFSRNKIMNTVNPIISFYMLINHSGIS